MNKARIQRIILAIFIGAMGASFATSSASYGQSKPLSSWQQLARDIFEELININTTDSRGSTTKAAEAMAARLKPAGFLPEDVQVLGPNSRKKNLVARLHGTGAHKPMLLLAHLDVVEAHREDWTFDPFKFFEKDGYFYGRGTTDDKAMAAIWIANLIRFKQEGFKPGRDIIVALTADEESGNNNGVKWLLQNQRQMVDAEDCFNEGGGGLIKNGKYLLNEVQASEKLYLSFNLEVKNRGGHSSLPTRDNAIYHLAEGLTRLAHFDFTVHFDEITRTYFERSAALESGQSAADMKAVTLTPPDSAAVARLSQISYYNALMRTTCVATRLAGGHADNALPQTARAVVNCRILPGESPDEVEKTLIRVLADKQIAVTRIAEPTPSSASPLKPEIMRPIEQITTQMWPGVPVIPTMSTGATDGLYLRNAGIPTYGVSGLFEDIDDFRAHGKDERIGVKSFFEAQEFLYRLVKAVSSSDRTS
jgi:acetylornithine deacetylase/succinyl-diaminopimelate desuccinylase-like protein